jgi:hypothetical protein
MRLWTVIQFIIIAWCAVVIGTIIGKSLPERNAVKETEKAILYGAAQKEVEACETTGGTYLVTFDVRSKAWGSVCEQSDIGAALDIMRAANPAGGK